MPSLPPPPPPPLPPPQQHHHHKKLAITAIPDFIFAAFSLFFLFSSSNSNSNSHKSAAKIPFPIYPRKFIRIPIMSRPTTKFPNPKSLSDWLRPRLAADAFAAWGVSPGTKNVHNLWLELSEGETTLLDGDSAPPVRAVDVVIVRVIGIGENSDKILVESHQQLSNGDVRARGRPLSEKMKPGESVDAAALRAVREELGSIFSGEMDPSAVRILPNSYSKKIEERLSVSYPGLPARYVLHTVDAVVKGLPGGEFCTEEAEEYEDSDERREANGAVSCKKHFWKWVDS